MFRTESQVNVSAPSLHYRKLIKSEKQFEVLRDGQPSAGFLLRDKPKFKGGRIILGSVHMPMVNGDLAPLFDWMLERTLGFMPTYLFILDGEYWDKGTETEREILMFHEMCHCDQARDEFGAPRFNRATGEPVWRLIGHDIEEFNAVAARYGEHSEDVRRFAAALKQHASGK
ncbi:MAG TPA: putative metallopeptidase [Rhizomicrobium sp.]|nr:putative metallopeptidase [Rhizomicrobium sp.]